MINGVLTERTVQEIIPILQTNSDGLKKALEELVKQYKSRQDEMEKWKVCVLLCFQAFLQPCCIELFDWSHELKTDGVITEEEQRPSCPTTPVAGF